MTEETPDICSSLSGLEKEICESYADSTLTINKLYKDFKIISSIIKPKLPILTRGLEDIIKKSATHLLIQNIIAHQLPWLIGFFLIIFTLLMTGTISIFSFVILLIASVVITIIIVGLSLYSSLHTIEKTVSELKSQMKTNVDDFKKKLV